MCALDASRPWLVYWIVHALELMHVQLDQVLKRQVVDFLAKCQNPSGGFGGGPGQMSHLAPTYAAVNAIAILKDPYGSSSSVKHFLSYISQSCLDRLRYDQQRKACLLAQHSQIGKWQLCHARRWRGEIAFDYECVSITDNLSRMMCEESIVPCLVQN